MRERASLYFPDLTSRSIEVTCTPFAGASSYPLLLCTVDAGNAQARSLIAKFPPVYPDNDEAETEFRLLTTMTSHLAARDDLRVPRPLDHFPDIHAILTEVTGGERFSQTLLRAASRRAGAAEAAALRLHATRAGEWLAEFHRATRAAPAVAFDEKWTGALQDRVSALESAGFPAGARTTLERTLARLCDWGDSRRVGVSTMHGDYGPQNFHVAPEWLCVFDLSYRRTAPVYDDLTYFIVTLETLNPLARSWTFDRRRALAMVDPFLDGYFGGTPSDEARILLEGTFLRALVERCHKQRRNSARRGATVRWFFDRSHTSSYYPSRIVRQCRRVESLLDG